LAKIHFNLQLFFLKTLYQGKFIIYDLQNTFDKCFSHMGLQGWGISSIVSSPSTG